MTSQPATELLSKEIFERIKTSANAKTSRALENLKSACDFLQKEGLDIIPARVGDMTAKMKGGPQKQSIRNNANFITYVKARRTECGVVESRRHLDSKSVHTGDVRVDAYIQTIEMELKIAQQDLRNIKKALPRNFTFDFDAAKEGQLVSVGGNGAVDLTEPERKDLSALLDSAHLEKLGLELSKGGQLRSCDTLRTLLGQDGVRVLQRLIGNSAGASNGY